MTANTTPPSINRVLSVLVCAAACLMMGSVRPAAAEECPLSIDLTFPGGAIKGDTSVERGDQGCGCQDTWKGTTDGEVTESTAVIGCKKTEVYKDSEEYRSRTTTINSDGSTNPQGKDTRMVVNKEQARIDHKGGEYGQFGGKWPDDEYTRRIPNPNVEVAFATVNKKDNSFSAMFKKGAMNTSSMKGYAERLKERGFTIDAKESEDAKYDIYAYRAKNSAGYFVQVSCSGGGACGLTLKSPKD
jgi:hypothetical protein